MKKLTIASIVLVALGALTFVQLNALRSEDTEQPKVTIELPKIKSDQVEELELAPPDKPKVRLVKKDGAWRVAEPVDAVADENAVNTAVTKLTELEMSSVAATLKKNHEKLEVDAAKGVHVIAKGGGKPLLDAYIGAYRSGSTMLRLEGQEPVAAVRGSIRFAFTKETREWRDRTITDIPTESVQQMTFVNAKGKLVFKRDLMAALLKDVTLPAPVWSAVTWSWIGFFFAMAVANWYVAFHFSTDTWVNFKVWGGIGLLLVFALAQGLWLARHMPEERS